jgi:hypothetical protein
LVSAATFSRVQQYCSKTSKNSSSPTPITQAPLSGSSVRGLGVRVKSGFGSEGWGFGCSSTRTPDPRIRPSDPRTCLASASPQRDSSRGATAGPRSVPPGHCRSYPFNQYHRVCKCDDPVGPERERSTSYSESMRSQQRLLSLQPLNPSITRGYQSTDWTRALHETLHSCAHCQSSTLPSSM